MTIDHNVVINDKFSVVWRYIPRNLSEVFRNLSNNVCRFGNDRSEYDVRDGVIRAVTVLSVTVRAISTLRGRACWVGNRFKGWAFTIIATCRTVSTRIQALKGDLRALCDQPLSLIFEFVPLSSLSSDSCAVVSDLLPEVGDGDLLILTAIRLLATRNKVFPTISSDRFCVYDSFLDALLEFIKDFLPDVFSFLLQFF
jgi:hypothetical protein